MRGVGLAKSRYGIVVLSPAFFAKEWPQKELDGLVAREVDGQKVILPIWHNITRKQVASYSLVLADKVAISTSKGILAICKALLAILKPDDSVPAEYETASSHLVLTFSYAKQKIASALHEYSLLVKIRNNSNKAVDSFKLVFSFPNAAITGRYAIDIVGNPYLDGGVSYVDIAYTHSKTIYPTEEVELLDAVSTKLEYKMNDLLYDSFLQRPPKIRWTLYLREGYPITGAEEFNDFQNY